MNITSHLPIYATTLGGAPTSDQRQTQTDVNKPTEERKNNSGGALGDTGCNHKNSTRF